MNNLHQFWTLVTPPLCVITDCRVTRQNLMHCIVGLAESNVHAMDTAFYDMYEIHLQTGKIVHPVANVYMSGC